MKPSPSLEEVVERLEETPQLSMERARTLHSAALAKAYPSMLEGKTYGEAMGAPAILNQSEEAFRAELKAIDNDLPKQLEIVSHSLEQWFQNGEMPAPYYPWRVAVILSKQGRKAEEAAFLQAWCKHFGNVKGARYEALAKRAGKVADNGEAPIVRKRAIGVARPRKRIYDLVGESRYQSALLWCDPGMPAQLVREPDNPHDPNAIAVWSGKDTLGYIAAGEAMELAPVLDAGDKPLARVHEVRGCVPDYPTIGCRIALEWEGDKPRKPKPMDNAQKAYRKKAQDKDLDSERGSGCLGVLAVVLFPLGLVGAVGIQLL